MKLFGWITKRSKFIQCKTYDHIEAIIDNSELQEYLSEENLSRLNELGDVEKECQELADREGNSNAEWHNYEMACADFDASIIWKNLIEKGCIRVGQSENSLHFEGSPLSLKDKIQFCKNLAEEHTLLAVFEPQKV